MMDVKICLLFGFCLGVGLVNWYNNFTVLYSMILFYAIYSLYEKTIQEWLQKNLLLKQPVRIPDRVEHDKRRNMTYPEPVANSWYHLCDSTDVPHGKVLEVRALGQTFVLWRTEEGKPVCQDAYCIHVGANLGVGGTIQDNCIQCPFHHWKFAADGTVKEIPYLDKPHECSSVTRKLKTYECVDWCGLICVYFHADGATSESQNFPLPNFVPEELERDNWAPHLKWDLGFKTLSPVDWVDQSGDHSHFNTLHADFLIPWTMIPIPKWLLKIFPLGIAHTLKTYIGDDKEWAEIVKKTGWGTVNKNYIFFTDLAGITWDKKPVQSTLSQTTELFIGPAMMVFHIPFTIGTFKVFVTTTPVEGGSVMKVRTWIDGRTRTSFWKPYIAWILSGISASQLMSDIDIMCNKIRQRKPLLVKGDGPYNRTNTWAMQFYSESSSKVSSCAYKNDW